MSAPSQGLSITFRASGPEMQVLLDGELDVATEPIFVRAVRSIDVRETKLVTLDLTRLRFVDSTGLHAILALNSRAMKRGGRVRVRNAVAPSVRKVLDISGVAPILSVEPPTRNGHN